jgi:hypothetical protein
MIPIPGRNSRPAPSTQVPAAPMLPAQANGARIHTMNAPHRACHAEHSQQIRRSLSAPRPAPRMFAHT